jgi:hypothetical protein
LARDSGRFFAVPGSERDQAAPFLFTHHFIFTFMKTYLLILSLFLFTLHAQEIGVSTQNSTESTPPAFEVLSSVTKREFRVEPAPLADMQPVRKRVSVTVQTVTDPQLYVEKEQVESITPSDTTNVQRLPLHARPKAFHPINLSATVHDRKFTFLRWYPHGNDAPAMTAWSNIDFSIFQGLNHFTYDGEKFSLFFMAIEHVDSQQRRLIAQRFGREYQAPLIPEIPPSKNGSFVMAQGDKTDSEAVKPIAAMHGLYRAEKQRLDAEYSARLHEQQVKVAELRANPPQPQDVLIRVWKSEAPLGNAPTPQVVTPTPQVVTPLPETSVEP